MIRKKMSDSAIKVNNISKTYRINSGKKQSIKETVTDTIKNLFKPTAGNRTEEFYALKDISFEIKKGEAIGFIGKNGAGKSTLLKILSRITPPSSGYIEMDGKVSSLLEVGTGFHPDLTGRENIFLNGTILGMTRFEIKTKFDEIVEFSGIGKFIDTPVKRYSSGMYVRLAFAVAAYLEPDILIIDEVLAVGDAEFQKKCLGKMEDVSKKEGRTVLFVSHNMSAVLSLCSKAVLLNAGKCVGFDTTEKMVAKYLATGKISQGVLSSDTLPFPNQKLKIRRIMVLDHHGKPGSEFDLRNDVFLQIEFQVLQEGKGYNLAFELISPTHGSIFASAMFDSDPELCLSQKFIIGKFSVRIKLPTYFLRGGEYLIKVSSTIPTAEILDVFEGELYFELLDTHSPVAKTTEGRPGVVLPVLSWEIL